MQCNLPKSFEHGAFQFESEAGSFSSGNHFSHNVKEIKLTRGCHGKRTSYLRRTSEQKEEEEEEEEEEGEGEGEDKEEEEEEEGEEELLEEEKEEEEELLEEEEEEEKEEDE